MRIVILFLLLVLFSFAAFFVSKNRMTSPSHLTPTPQSATPTPGKTAIILCEPEQLLGTIALEPAAGNIYGSLILTNIGNVPCNVILGKSITAFFKAQNISLSYEPAGNPEEFTLQPTEKAYSQVHYPNGPQCSGPTVQQGVSFLYEVDQKTVLFKEINTKAQLVTVQACSSQSEMTTIDVWPLSRNPISQ